MTQAEAKAQAKQASIDDWTRIFMSQTDPDAIARAKRAAAKKRRTEQIRKDAGL